MRKPTRIGDVIAQWMERGQLLAGLRAQVDGATIVADFVADLQRIETAETDDLLTLTEAAKECGYNADSLGRMIRENRLTNHGRPNAPRVRRGELPRRARSDLGLEDSSALAVVAGERASLAAITRDAVRAKVSRARR